MIHVSKIVISIPFTSTGVIAKDQNVRSIYYDPCSIIEHNDDNIVNLISGKKELSLLIKNLNENN